MSDKDIKLEWSRWVPWPVIGMHVVFMTNEEGSESTRGVVEVGGIRSEGGTLTPSAEIGTWKPSVLARRAA